MCVDSGSSAEANGLSVLESLRRGRAEIGKKSQQMSQTIPVTKTWLARNTEDDVLVVDVVQGDN